MTRDWTKATLLATVCLIALVLSGTFARIVYLNATTPSPLTCKP